MILLCVYKLQDALSGYSLAGHYAEIVTGHYFGIAPAAVVGCDDPGFFLRKSQHMHILELSKQPNG